ncbi:MAG: hypothetical protein ACK42E_00650 [Candidatus Bipolaricaulaceae bacterium]
MGSLFLVLVATFFSGWPTAWRLAGGSLLFGLWLLGLRQPDLRAVRLLPGHALLFFAAGRTECRSGLHLWLAAMAITFGLLAPWPWARPLWAILWPVSLAAIHQVGARKLAGPAFWAWTAGLSLLGLALTVREMRTILRTRGEK